MRKVHPEAARATDGADGSGPAGRCRAIPGFGAIQGENADVHHHDATERRMAGDAAFLFFAGVFRGVVVSWW
jgi:hypothetical protein